MHFQVKEKSQIVNNDTIATEESQNIEVKASNTTSDLPNPQPKHRVEFKEPQVSTEPVKEITKVNDSFFIL